MTKQFSIEEELPLESDHPLPYLAVYKSAIPKRALFPLVIMMISVAGLVLTSEESYWRLIFVATELLSIIGIIVIIKQSLKKRKTAWNRLDEEVDNFIESVQLRYKVTLTETILYSIVQGGNTLLSDKNGQLTRIMILSDPETRTTKLIAGKL